MKDNDTDTKQGIGVKIQINTLAALERLIGGDTTLEADLRRSVAVAFARKHINTLLAAEVRSAANAVRVQMTAALEAAGIRARDGGAGTYHSIALTTEIKKEIRQEVANAVKAEIGEAVNALNGTMAAEVNATAKGLIDQWTTAMKNHVNAEVTAVQAAAVRREVDARFTALMNQLVSNVSGSKV